MSQSEVARRRAKFDISSSTDRPTEHTGPPKEISRQSVHNRLLDSAEVMEKEVTDNVPKISRTDLFTGRSGSRSPVKNENAGPSTPGRGRSKTRKDMVDQRFTLSRSRSHSRGVRVSVEIKASPERPNEEAVVIVRATVDSVEEDLHEE